MLNFAPEASGPSDIKTDVTSIGPTLRSLYTMIRIGNDIPIQRLRSQVPWACYCSTKAWMHGVGVVLLRRVIDTVFAVYTKTKKEGEGGGCCPFIKPPHTHHLKDNRLGSLYMNAIPKAIRTTCSPRSRITTRWTYLG